MFFLVVISCHIGHHVFFGSCLAEHAVYGARVAAKRAEPGVILICPPGTCAARQRATCTRQPPHERITTKKNQGSDEDDAKKPNRWQRETRERTLSAGSGPSIN
jgi:hypothetical protein